MRVQWRCESIALSPLEWLARHMPSTTIVASVGSVFMSIRHNSFTFGVHFDATRKNHHALGLFAIAKALFATAFA